MRPGKLFLRRAFLALATLLCSRGVLEGVTLQGHVVGYALNPSTSDNLPYTGPASVSGPYPIPFARVGVIVNGNENWVSATNASGDFSIPTSLGANQTATVRVTLEVPPGLVSGVTYYITNKWGANVRAEKTDLAGNFTPSTVLTFNSAKLEPETAQVTAFLHLRQIADYAQSHSAAWSPPYEISGFSCEVNWDLAAPCGEQLAGYANYTIFTRRQKTCAGQNPALVRNTAYSTVLYHEFGHNFMKRPGYQTVLDTNEIFADLFSAYFTGSPVIAKDVFGQGTLRRDISSLWLYPVVNPSDPLHDPGRPFTGSMWEVREALVSADPVNGPETANRLFFGWLRGYIEAGADPPIGPGLLEDVLDADDEVFNAGRGRPPHGELIAAAFGHHNVLIQFRRGDANSDGAVNVTDVVAILNALFYGEDCLCWDAADANDDGAANITDATFLWSHLFNGGDPPPAPYPECGTDAYDSDELFCVRGGCP